MVWFCWLWLLLGFYVDTVRLSFYYSMDTLQRHMPVAGQDGVDELLKIAWRFEQKIFQAATDQVSGLLACVLFCKEWCFLEITSMFRFTFVHKVIDSIDF